MAAHGAHVVRQRITSGKTKGKSKRKPGITALQGFIANTQANAALKALREKRLGKK